MAIVRCMGCQQANIPGMNIGRWVNPIGYPNTAITCGNGNCPAPGMVGLDGPESVQYQGGARIFTLLPHVSKVRVQ